MTDTDLEQRLKRDLAQAADAAPESATVARRVIDTADRPDTHRRFVIAALAAGAAAATVTAVALAAGPDQSAVPRPSPGDSAPTTTDGKPAVSEALAALPLGEPARKPFVIDTTLYDSGKTVRLPGTRGDVYGRVDGGWLVRVDHDERSSGGTYTSELGVLDASGELRVLASQDRGPTTDHVALSPDHEQVFIRGDVVDIASGELVDRLADKVTQTYGWNETGIVYLSGASRRTSIWAPGEAPQPLNREIGFVGTQSTRALASFSCRWPVELSATGQLTTIGTRDCDEPSGIELSPDGRHVITVDGLLGAIAVDDRTVTEFRGLAPVRDRIAVAVQDWRLRLLPGWEDDEHVLIPVSPDPRGGGPIQVVRCAVPSGQCERAGPPVPAPADRKGFAETVSFSDYPGVW